MVFRPTIKIMAAILDPSAVPDSDNSMFPQSAVPSDQRKSGFGTRGHRWNSYKMSRLLRGRLALEITDLSSYEIPQIEPRPFDDAMLRELLSECWFTASRLGESGEALFGYYQEVGEDDTTDFDALWNRTVELFASAQSTIPPDNASRAFCHFASLHRFYALLSVDPAPPYEKSALEFAPLVRSTLQWIVNFLTTMVFQDFIRALKNSPESVSSLIGFKNALTLRLGAYVWEKVVAAVDAKLSNLLLTNKEFATVQNLRDAQSGLESMCAAIGVSMPLFGQSLNFILNYQRVLRDSVAFDEVAPDIPADFLLAMVMAGKRKRLIPLELSDKRVLAAADAAGIDVSRLDDVCLRAKEPELDVPHAIWMDGFLPAM
jgi:hypothetical protein